MGRIGLAFRLFFDILFHAEKAEKVRSLNLDAPATEPSVVESSIKDVPTPQPKPPASGRSDALTLLESLQREARFLDFIQEDISQYQDSQIGQAVRDVHRGTRAVLDRFFQIVPATESVEGTRLTIQGDESAALYRLVGKVTETRPATGTVVHSGWKAQKSDLPIWTGSGDSKHILAPTEIEFP